MSKKLIAVAAASALALSGLVGIAPANSAVGPFAVSVSGTTSTATAARDGSTSTKALQINVPSADVIRLVATNATLAQGDSTAINFDVVTPGATDVVTVTATGAVKLLTTTQFDDGAKVATGTASLSVAAVSGDAEFYAYTTSTTAGTVVVSAGGSSKTYHVAGLSTSGYKLALTAPASVSLSGDIKLTGTVKDAFGNDLTTPLNGTFANEFTATAVGATAPSAVTYTAATKSYEFKFTAPATAQSVAVQVGLKITPTTVTAFGSPVLTQFFTVSTVDQAAQVTALTAQVAALTAQLAASVSSAKYNKLVRKWNRANPSNKVKRVG